MFVITHILQWDLTGKSTESFVCTAVNLLTEEANVFACVRLTGNYHATMFATSTYYSLVPCLYCLLCVRLRIITFSDW